MTLIFPAAPTNGQVVVQGSSSWTFDGAKWVATGAKAAVPDEVGFACSDYTTALAVKNAVASIRMPYALKLSSVRFGVTTAPTGAAIVLDAKCNGVSIFTTKPEIAAGAFSTVNSAAPGVLATTILPDDAIISVDIVQVGSTIHGLGLGCWLLGARI